MDYTLTVKVDTHKGSHRQSQHLVQKNEINMIQGIFQGLSKNPNGSRIWDVEGFDFEPMRKKYAHVYDDYEFRLLCKLIPTCSYGYTRSIESVTLTPNTEIITII